MKRTHINLSVPLIEKLKELSAQKDVSVSELIRRAVEDYLEKTENANQDREEKR